MKEILFACIKSFLAAICAMIGVAFGLILLIGIVSSFSDKKSWQQLEEPEKIYSEEIAPNAEGVRKVMGKETPVILKLNIEGIIGTDSVTAEAVRNQLMETQEGDLGKRVKAILLTINSPGGTVSDADGIYRAIKAYKEKHQIPVYAYLNGICASGGMYVAAAADQIYSNDITLLGSIGVITPPLFNVAQLLEKIGVQALTITAGKDKDLLNPTRPWKPGEQEIMQSLIDYYYQIFVTVMVHNRPQVNKTQLVDEVGAKIFNAQQALSYGLVDVAAADYPSTLKAILNVLQIDNDAYQVIELTHKNWFNDLFKSEWGILNGKVTHQLSLFPDLDPKLMNQFLYLYRPS